MHGLESFQCVGFLRLDRLVNIVRGSSSRVGICLTFTLRAARKPGVRSNDDNFGDVIICVILASG